MTWPEPALFSWMLAGLTTLGALLPLDVGRQRDDHIVLTITATFVLAILGPWGLLVIWGSALTALALRFVAGARGRGGRAWWLLGTTCAITIGFSLAHPTYTVLLDRRYPLEVGTGGDLALSALVLGVAWVGTMATRLVLHRTAAAATTHRSTAAGADDGPDSDSNGDIGSALVGVSGSFDPFGSPLVPYLLPTVAGAPILAAALALYRPEAPWPAGILLMWCLPLYGACRFDLHRRHLAHQFRRDAAARQRLAAIGEVTARIVHQSRHEAGLMGWSIHRLRRLLADPSPDLTAATRELDVLTTAKQHIQDTFDRELLHEPATPSGRHTTSASGLDQAVEGVCAVLDPKAERLGVTVGRRVDQDAAATACPGALHEVLFNLVDNAVDAAGSSVQVVARSTGQSPSDDEPQGGQVVIEIDDDGPGIPPDVATDLYEPFVSTKLHGSGMGLAIAAALVAEMDGQLHHDRHRARTRFVVTVPSDRPEAGASGSGSHETRSPGRSHSAFS